jgi:hypothetical protein
MTWFVRISFPLSAVLISARFFFSMLLPLLKTMGRDEAGTRFNVFRRFREAVLQRSEARQILIDYWMGHSNPSMGDRYGKQLVEDVEYRQEQAKKVGLGFDHRRSHLGYVGYKMSVTSATTKPPKCYNE